MSWNSDIFESSLEEPPPKNIKLRKDDGRVEEHSELAKKSACKQRMLTKTERDTIILKLKGLDPQEIASASLAATRKQLPMLNTGLQELCSAVNSCELCFFIEHLQDTFMALYKECSTVKERYLHFQIKRLQHCSYYLVTNNSTLSDLGLLPQDPVQIKL